MISVVNLNLFNRMIKASLVISSLLFLWGCGNQERYIHLSGDIFGTQYHITAKLANDDQQKILTDRVNQRLAEVDMSMSTYKAASEISQFNA